jgi:hypothetical protein
MEKKIIEIDHKKFQVNDYSQMLLRERLTVDKLIAKMPTAENRKAEGLTADETVQFYCAILTPINHSDYSVIEKISPAAELEVSAHFFISRMSITLNGISSIMKLMKNTNLPLQRLSELPKEKPNTLKAVWMKLKNFFSFT